MPRPSRKTKILTPKEMRHALKTVKTHRYPEKNSAILYLCFCLGLTAKEVAGLQINHVAKISESGSSFELLERITIPIYEQQNSSVQGSWGYNISLENLKSMILKVAHDARKGIAIDYEEYLPPRKQYEKAARVLPLVTPSLRDSLVDYLSIREHDCRRSDSLLDAPLILSQKGCAYSANTLQDHIKLMLADWAGITDATSLSGRMSLLNHMRKNGISVVDTQQFLGHMFPATTASAELPNLGSESVYFDLGGNTSYNDVLEAYPV